MEKYLNFNILLEKYSKNELIEYGFVKLFLIRQFSIHYRHAIKKIDPQIIENKKLQKKIDNIKILKIFIEKMRKLHKIPRNFYVFKIRKIDIYLDFDDTLTSMVKIAQQHNFNVNYFILKSISGKIKEYFKKDFYNYFIGEENFLNYFKVSIVSARDTNEKNNIKKYLKKYNINLVKSIYCLKGNENKIDFIIKKSPKKSILFLIDDNKDILNICKYYFVLPIYCIKGRLKKVIDNKILFKGE